MWYNCSWLMMNVQMTSDNVKSRVNNVVDVAAINVTKIFSEPRPAQNHLPYSQHS